MKYEERIKQKADTSRLEIIRGESELRKYLTDKFYELAEVELNLENAKNKNPISISEILGLMNKKDLINRAINQAKDLRDELF